MNSIRPISDFFVNPYKNSINNIESLRNKNNNYTTKEKIILIVLSILELIPVAGHLALRLQQRIFKEVKIDAQKNPQIDSKLQNTNHKSNSTLKFIREIGISILTASLALPLESAFTCLHEYGHALAMMGMLGVDKEIKITLKGIVGGGSCDWPMNMDPSYLGSFFSKNGQHAIISAGGPVIESIGTSLLALNSPELCWGSALGVALYALDPIFGRGKDLAGHDFYSIIENGGYLSYAATLGICLAPTVITLGSLYNKYNNLISDLFDKTPSNKTTTITV